MRKFFGFLISSVLTVGILLSVCVTRAHADGNGAWYDPAAEGVVSGYLRIDRDGGCITGIAPGTSVQTLNTLCLPGDLTASGEVLGTGTVLTSAKAAQSLAAVVTGDVNSDGAVTISDLLMVKSHVLGTELLDLAALAGDVNYDGGVSISDFLLIKSYLLELTDITSPNADGREPMIILAPHETHTWDISAADYASHDPQIASVTADGTITAGSAEGSTFVYARNAAGEVISRTAVTVLEGGLAVTLDKDTYAPCPGQSLTATAQLNHPISVPIRWESSDSAICSVSQTGELTGNTLGSAMLRATLPNGSYAEAAIQVMPPITELDFETHLYKVKPNATRQLTLIVAPADTGEEITWSSSDPSIATVSDTGLVTGVDYGTVTVTATGRYSGLVATCSVKVCNVKQVAITFDDGPSKNTAKLLDWLKENEVKATFFVVGNRVNSYKGTVKRIVNEGHELGYHSYAHKTQTGLSTDKIISDYEKSDKLVRDLTGQGFTVWRTPGGGYNKRVLDAVPLPHIMWAVDTRDWETRKTDHVYRMITKYSDDGEIILLHDLYKTSVDGAIKAMKEMLAGDYEFLTVTELLSRNGTPPSPHTSYKKAPK